jgi:tetratricopeptide (TPR) repeat protein
MSACVLWIYATLGSSVAWVFYRSQRLREHASAQAVASALSIGGGAVTLAILDRVVDSGPELSNDTLGQGFFFLCAAICHAPTIIYILLFQWNRLLEELTTPGRRDLPKSHANRTERDEWRAVEAHMKALAKDPLDSVERRQLAECYLRLDLPESAISAYSRAAECVPRGYEHGYLLFKAARLIIDRTLDTRRALPVLRRIIRLYPKSWFAAYSRRVLNEYEARVTER